jgi:hypothetical protein
LDFARGNQGGPGLSRGHERALVLSAAQPGKKKHHPQTWTVGDSARPWGKERRDGRKEKKGWRCSLARHWLPGCPGRCERRILGRLMRPAQIIKAARQRTFLFPADRRWLPGTGAGVLQSVSVAGGFQGGDCGVSRTPSSCHAAVQAIDNGKFPSRQFHGFSRRCPGSRNTPSQPSHRRLRNRAGAVAF